LYEISWQAGHVSSELFNFCNTTNPSAWLLPGNIQVVCNAADALPPVPAHLDVLHRQLLCLPIDLEAVRELVNHQKLLRWHVLRIANMDSAPDSRLGLEHAILLLGAERLRHLAAACALTASPNIVGDSHMIGMAAQAALRAMIAQQMATEFNFEDCELAYMAALLRDLGKHVHTQRTISAQRDRDQDRMAAETGAWMAALWNLPSRLVDAVRSCVIPEQAGSDAMLIEIVNWADAVGTAATAPLGQVAECGACEPLQNALKLHLLDAGESECKHIAESIWERFSNLLSVMGDAAH
jgi:HD-like signal output (HDOD) protein